MRHILLLVGILVILASCKKEGMPSVMGEDFSQSYNAWIKFKKSSRNSYQYTVVTSSASGNTTKTTISINKGTVISRAFESYRMDNINIQKISGKMWIENSENLYSHPEGAEALTLDDIYERAKNIWLNVDRLQNTLHFEAKNNGIVSSCGYNPKDCTDDCFTGINIMDIKAL